MTSIITLTFFIVIMRHLYLKKTKCVALVVGKQAGIYNIQGNKTHEFPSFYSE